MVSEYRWPLVSLYMYSSLHNSTAVIYIQAEAVIYIGSVLVVHIHAVL